MTDTARPLDSNELRNDETIANALWNAVMIPDTMYLSDMPADVQVAWQRAAARVAATVDHVTMVEEVRMREFARQVHARHDLGHQLGAWPNACALCEVFS